MKTNTFILASAALFALGVSFAAPGNVFCRRLLQIGRLSVAINGNVWTRRESQSRGALQRRKTAVIRKSGDIDTSS